MARSKEPSKVTDSPEERAREEARIARRNRRQEMARREILDAARRALLRDGIGATTLDAVAAEAGLSKTALYYYFPSKDALFFELIFASHDAHAHAVHDAVEVAEDGAEALGAIIRQTIECYAPHLDDFRLAFMHGQVASPGSVHFDAEQFARIRPLNDLLFAGTAEQLEREQAAASGGADVEPRLMAFLAYLSALGLLTMKGMVESLDDPLVYSDEQLVEGFERVFAKAASPGEKQEG
jgi:AcrR family transcriptional regulator